MSKRRVFLTIMLAMGLLAPASVVTPARAAEFQCTFAFDLLLAPGMGAKPTAGTARTEGESGTFNCSGYQGTLGLDGRYDPLSCGSGGKGTGVLSATLGGQRFSDNVTLGFARFVDGTVAGTIDGARVDGTFVLTPTAGDCGRAPITRGAVKGEGVVRS